jgi:sulfite exporter TauE/SafE
MLTQPIVLGALTGLASSLHCAAMCGPLAASTCSRRAPRTSLLRYQLGRLAGYGAAGALAGGVGHVLRLTTSAPWLGYAVPAITVLALLALAHKVLGGRPALAQLGRKPEQPRSALFARLARLAPRDPSVVGALTALLPCAALGAALVLAAATQSRSAGAMLMLGFAATSALGVIGGAFVLARVTQVGGRVAPRVLAIALACAALYVGFVPVYRAFHSADASAPAASCH